MSKPYTFYPAIMSLKLRLSPNSYFWFLFVLIYILRIWLSFELYLTLKSFMKSPSTSMYFISLHFAKYCPGNGTMILLLASSSSYTAWKAISKFLADAWCYSYHTLKPTIYAFLLSFSANLSSKVIFPPRIPAKSLRSSGCFWGYSCICAPVAKYYLSSLLLFLNYMCFYQMCLYLFSYICNLNFFSSIYFRFFILLLFESINCSFLRLLIIDFFT